MERYRTLNRYLQERFGKKIYKLAINAGFTCPNRDGSKGKGGCIFCSAQGSGDFAQSGRDVLEQLQKAKEKVQNKVPQNCGYIAYFQAFTNTYAPKEKLEELFRAAMEPKEIVALSVATRPDCLSRETVELLSVLNKQKPIIIELGLQTSNEQTAKRINRCYENSEFTKAVAALRKAELEVVVHMIIGLPGETRHDMLQTIDFITKHDVQGIKLQLLHVLKGTALAQMPYTPLSMEDYFKILGDCIERLPPEIVIHRLTGDGPKKDLIAPLWSADKKNVLNKMNQYFEANDIRQGKQKDRV